MNHHIQETRLWEWFGSYGYLSHLHSIHGNTGCIILHYHHGLGSHSHSVTGNRQSIYRSFLRPYRCGLCCTDGLHTWGWRAPNDIDPANQRGALGSFPLGIHGFPMVFLWMGTWSFSSWFSMWDLPWNAHAFGINLGYFQWLLSPPHMLRGLAVFFP